MKKVRAKLLYHLDRGAKMKKAIPMILGLAVLGSPLAAQEPGMGAANGSNTGRDNAWPGYVFAGGAVAAAVAGIIIIATNNSSDQVNFIHSSH